MQKKTNTYERKCGDINIVNAIPQLRGSIRMKKHAYYNNMFIFFVYFDSNNISDTILQVNEFLTFPYSIALDTLFTCAVECDEATLRCNCRQKNIISVF
jgi:hypothetical protein